MASAAACGLGARRQPTAQSARGINYPSERASTFDKGNFGRGITSIAWRAPWVITALFTSAPGMQYAIVSLSNHGGTGTYYQLGILKRGNFAKIRVPGAGIGSLIEFMSNSANSKPIIRVSPLGRASAQYEVKRSTVLPIARKLLGPSYHEPPVIFCQDVRRTNPKYAFLRNGLPVISKAELNYATRGFANSSQAYVKCYHFAAMDIVEVGSSLGPAVTYTATADRLVFLTRGAAEFASPRYLLFRVTESSLTTFHGANQTEYQDYMQDYLEVFATT